MRPLRVILPLLTWISCGLATQEDLLYALQHYPRCGLDCLTTSVTQSPCSLIDTECQCKNHKIQVDVTACVRNNCTIKDSLNTQNISAILCHLPIRNKSKSTRVSNILCTVVANAVSWPRLIFRATRIRPELGLDDAMVLLSLVIGVPSVVIIDRQMIPSGLGRDLWTLQFEEITAFVKSFYFLEFLYFLQLAISKLALLFFCLRIFPKPSVRYLLWATVVFTILWGVLSALISTFQCLPIRYSWTKWDARKPPRGCLDIRALAWSNAGISIGLDVWMLLMPLTQVLQLQLSWRRKLGATIMFGVGIFVTIVSVIRLWSIGTASHTNPTWDQAKLVYWSSIEVNVGVICACLPTWRLIVVHGYRKVFPKKREHSSSGEIANKKKENSPLNSSAFGSMVNEGQTDSMDLKDPRRSNRLSLPHIVADESRLMRVSQFRASKIDLDTFETMAEHEKGNSAEQEVVHLEQVASERLQVSRNNNVNESCQPICHKLSRLITSGAHAV